MDLRDDNESGRAVVAEGADSLSPIEREIIVELQKSLMTLQQINDSLVKAIAQTKAGSELLRAQQEVVDSGRKIFSKALGQEGKEEGAVVEEGDRTSGEE